MSARLIRVSTRRTGERFTVRVYVYDDLDELRDAAKRFSGQSDEEWKDSLGGCQTYGIVGDDGKLADLGPVIVRLWRGALTARIVVHEISHAAAEIYGRSLDADATVGDHLDCTNETLAHLHSDLTSAVIDRLYALGYYG